MKTYPVVELLGDGIGAELAAAVRLLATSALPFAIEWRPFDLSVESRASRGEALYDEAAREIEKTAAALKYPTATVKESPNQVLRRRLGLQVIHRPVQTIPGIPTNFKADVDLDVVRIATGGTYDDPGQMIGTEAAVSLRVIEKEPCRQAAVFAFELARKTKKSVTSSSKHTIQRMTDGLFEAVVKEVSRDYPDVPHRVELFDALLAKIVLKPRNFQIVLVLNEYGDFLSDMACGLVGSLGIGASGNYGFDRERRVRVGLFDAAHGTAPDIAGQGRANPTAIFLAFALLLYHLGEVRAGSAVKNAALDLLREGESTPDVGGKLATTEFAEKVAGRTNRHILDPAWTSRTLQLQRDRPEK
ncbi:MAG: isocitrate/isopropylmalate dehydrogenase family protein [Planctomycetes bacterium]|nr:isocitrate/isopropylmalate dehydrogenase family protein [Planctomycetota bacterium]